MARMGQEMGEYCNALSLQMHEIKGICTGMRSDIGDIRLKVDFMDSFFSLYFPDYKHAKERRVENEQRQQHLQRRTPNTIPATAPSFPTSVPVPFQNAGMTNGREGNCQNSQNYSASKTSQAKETRPEVEKNFLMTNTGLFRGSVSVMAPPASQSPHVSNNTTSATPSPQATSNGSSNTAPPKRRGRKRKTPVIPVPGTDEGFQKETPVKPNSDFTSDFMNTNTSKYPSSKIPAASIPTSILRDAIVRGTEARTSATTSTIDLLNGNSSGYENNGSLSTPKSKLIPRQNDASIPEISLISPTNPIGESSGASNNSFENSAITKPNHSTIVDFTRVRVDNLGQAEKKLPTVIANVESLISNFSSGSNSSGSNESVCQLKGVALLAAVSRLYSKEIESNVGRHSTEALFQNLDQAIPEIAFAPISSASQSPTTSTSTLLEDGGQQEHEIGLICDSMINTVAKNLGDSNPPV